MSWLSLDRFERFERWTPPNRFQLWVPRACLGLAGVLLAIGAVTLVHAVRFVQGAERATGTVIDLDSETSDGGVGDLVYYPRVRFTTAEGQTVEFRSSSGSSSPPDVGDSVEVLYDPDDPHDAQLSGFFSLWLWPIALGGVGIGFAAAGLFYPGTGPLARRRRRGRWLLESEDSSRSPRLHDEDGNGTAV